MPRPIRAPFTIPYGAQFGADRAGGKRRHNGTDYHCPVGTPIYGTEEGGRVTSIGYSPDPWNGAGHWVKIIYPSGSTTDMHMDERTRLSIGSMVGPTTLVGDVGLTGNAVNASPPGSHLHHERRKSNGLLVNPEALYGGQPAGIDRTPIAVPTRENHMLVYKIVGGGLSGTLWGLAPGSLFCAADAASGLLLAKDWNPSGAPIDRSEAEVRKIAGYLGIPDSLIAAGMAGVNWSWAKDAAARVEAPAASSGGTVDLSPVLAAIASIPGDVRSAIIKE